MPKCLVRWRVEGETLLDTDDTERACETVSELLKEFDLPGYVRNETKYDDPEILDCTLVDRGGK